MLSLFLYLLYLPPLLTTIIFTILNKLIIYYDIEIIIIIIIISSSFIIIKCTIFLSSLFVLLLFLLYNYLFIKLGTKVMKDRNTYFTRHLRWLKSSIFLVYLVLIKEVCVSAKSDIVFVI